MGVGVRSDRYQTIRDRAQLSVIENPVALGAKRLPQLPADHEDRHGNFARLQLGQSVVDKALPAIIRSDDYVAVVAGEHGRVTSAEGFGPAQYTIHLSCESLTLLRHHLMVKEDGDPPLER